MDLADCAAFGLLTSSIVAGGSVSIAVFHQLLHGGQVGAGIEQIAGEGAAKIMWCEGRYPCFLATLVEQKVNALICELAFGYQVTFANPDKERPGSSPRTRN